MDGLLVETQQILDAVRERSGRDVLFVRDDNMAVLATLQIARSGAAAHVLRYKPANRPIDYFVAYQAGFALRLFDNAPDARFDFAPTGNAQRDVEGLLAAGQRLTDEDREILPHFAGTVAHWALMSLRSHPIGMRIDQWIHDEYPALGNLQAEGMATIQQQNVVALSQRFGRLSVPVSLLGLNSAYAFFCDRLLDSTTYGIAYDAAGAGEQGRELLSLFDTSPADPSLDRALVDAWAIELGMREWYRWIPYTL